MATMTVEIDKAGRIVVPKKLRDAMHLTPGTKLRLKRQGSTLVLDADITMSTLEFGSGWPVAVPVDRVNAPQIDTEFVNEVLAQTYLERESRILGIDEEL